MIPEVKDWIEASRAKQYPSSALVHCWHYRTPCGSADTAAGPGRRCNGSGSGAQRQLGVSHRFLQRRLHLQWGVDGEWRSRVGRIVGISFSLSLSYGVIGHKKTYLADCVIHGDGFMISHMAKFAIQLNKPTSHN